MIVDFVKCKITIEEKDKQIPKQELDKKKKIAQKMFKYCEGCIYYKAPCANHPMQLNYDGTFSCRNKEFKL